MRTPQIKPRLTGPVILAVGIHLVLFALLFVSYTSEPQLPESRPVIKARLYQLESQNKAEQKTTQKIAGDAEKTAARQHEREQLEQKKQQQLARQREQQRQQEAKKAAEQKRQQQLAAEKKRQQEQEKVLAAKRLAEQQAAKKAAEKQRQQQLAAEKQRQQQAAKERELAEKQRQRKIEEEKQAAALAELLSEQTRYQRELADRQAKEDIGRINDRIIGLVSRNWIRPPVGLGKGITVEVAVEFLPDGRIKTATVSKTSGNHAFDNSAVAAILGVVRIDEIQQLDRAIYEKTYRNITMAFRPEDLE